MNKDEKATIKDQKKFLIPKKLIITEKPSVAREYAKVLGVSSSSKTNGYIEDLDYVITWCVGHLVTMSYPEKYDVELAKWKLETLPFLPNEQDYKYEVIESVKKQFDIVKKLLNRSDIECIYYAGDSGVEGICIQERVRRQAGHNPSAVEKCVWIDSYTAEEIKKGIRQAKPMDDYKLLADAGYMRAIEDYAIGINFSRLLTILYAPILAKTLEVKHTHISIGRVMTCVLGMVVTRERQIRLFQEVPFYELKATIGENIEVGWKAVEQSTYYQSPLLFKDTGFKKKEDAISLKNRLSSSNNAQIVSLEKKDTKKNAPLLYNLAELQSDCSKKYKISPDETLKIIQELYEKKLTTYPRTDARVLTKAVAKEIRNTLVGLQKYEFTKPIIAPIMKHKWYENLVNTKYVNDKKVTDHYAIIPTGQGLKAIDELKPKYLQIYQLILKRFLCIFYPPAIYTNFQLTAQIQNEYFFTSSSALKQKGYLEIMEDSNEENKEPFNLIDSFEHLNKGSQLPINKIYIHEGKTTPPKRYNSGSIILAMENAGQLIEDDALRETIKANGIGTSATRAEILKKLVNQNYLTLNKKTQLLTPTIQGEMIYEIVGATIKILLNPEFTASWQKGLDLIENGTISSSQYYEKLCDFVKEQTTSVISEQRISYLQKRFALVQQQYSKTKK